MFLCTTYAAVSDHFWVRLSSQSLSSYILRGTLVHNVGLSVRGDGDWTRSISVINFPTDKSPLFSILSLFRRPFLLLPFFSLLFPGIPKWAANGVNSAPFIIG